LAPPPLPLIPVCSGRKKEREGKKDENTKFLPFFVTAILKRAEKLATFL
jgi:hypothetical protein